MPQEGKKYIISDDRFPIILNNIYDLASENDVQEIMYEEKMHRTIFGSRQNLDGLEQTPEETNWIRIRVGDTNCDGTSQCTITYINKRHSEDKTDSSQFVVEDYYSAIQFFKKIGFPLLSEQETLRSKYVFNYENVKYIICFDKWPHIDEMLFVTITASDNVSEKGLSSVCKSLQLPKLAMQVGYVDIDKAYEQRVGKKASEIRQLRFNIALT
jgi:adenylate cyclase class IV